MLAGARRPPGLTAALVVLWLSGPAGGADSPVRSTVTSTVTSAIPSTITIGAEDDAAPWSYANGAGYVNDLVRAAFQESGWAVQFKVIPYPRCKAQAVAGQLAGCFSVSREPELEATLLFPMHAVFQAQNLLIARNDSPWTGCDPKAWGRQPVVGLVRGYEYTGRINQLVASGGIKADLAESEVSSLRKLSAGRTQATVVTLDEVKRIDYLTRLAQVPEGFKTICHFGALPAYVAFSRSHPQGAAALAAFEQGYTRLQQRGAIAALQSAWQRRALDSAAAKKH